MDDTADDAATMRAPDREPQGVGAFLRARRTQLGLTHGDVAGVVKLPARRIAALEDERWDELPSGPFLRGFLRNVARALDLDVATLTARVDDSLMRARNPDSILVSPHAPHGVLPRRNGPVDDRHGGRRLIVGAIGFAVIAALIAWSGTESFEATVATGKRWMAPLPSSAATSAPTSTASSLATPADPAAVRAAGDTSAASAAAASGAAALGAAPPGGTSAAAPSGTPAVVPDAAQSAVGSAAAARASNAASSLALLFHFNEESWVEVKSADGRVLLKSLQAAGSEQQVEGEAPFSLVVGNAKGVALRFRGQPVDLGPYTRDQVARLTLS